MRGGGDTHDVQCERATEVGNSGSRAVARNGLFAATQVGLTSIGYLLAYKVMGASVGIGVIGAWTLCLALGSVATLADLGASEGLVRSIAQRAATPDIAIVRRVLVTGLLFCAICATLGVVLCYMGLGAGLPLLISDISARETTMSVLAPAMVVAVLNTLGLSCQGVLEGLEKYHFRFAAGATGTTVFVATIFAYVPESGLKGVVWAYLAQAITVLAVSFTLCLWFTRSSHRGSNRPSLELVGELVKVGLPMRATGLVSVALDPLTRVAVTYYGGASGAGHYEIASRLVLQLRTLIVAGFQASLPRLVKLQVLERAAVSRLEGQTFRGGLLIAVAVFTMAALLGPVIYEFVLGEVPHIGMRFFVMLCAGWCVNATSAPYYFSLVAKRRFAAMWLSSGLMALTNVLLFVPLGGQFGAQGVVATLAISIAVGSIVTIVAALRENDDVGKLLRIPELVLLGTSAAVIAAFVGPALRAGNQSAAPAILVLLTAVYAVVALLALHSSGIFRK